MRRSQYVCDQCGAELDIEEVLFSFTRHFCNYDCKQRYEVEGEDRE